MLGGMFAGTEECEGEWSYEGGQKKSLSFFGMSSEKAQIKHSGGLKSYTASEGRVKKIPYKGRAKDVLYDILGGVRSCCSYIGATCVKDMGKCAEMGRVSRTHFDGSL